MNKKKIINDPVYGFIQIPFEIVYDVMEHPYFQRLRRIKQLGLTHYVYPGAVHSRLHHALGSMHLMTQALEVLKTKGVDISEEESIAACLAILLHDIGHGPFSHSLEFTLVNTSHEEIGKWLFRYFLDEYGPPFDIALSLFDNTYHKKYLCQLIASQLDMDRMDYLNRDSFYTGVMEGKIGYNRLIKMMNVVDDDLVIEEKGILSVEKFLIARKLMYWQVYLHKTAVCAEGMMKKLIGRIKDLFLQEKFEVTDNDLAFLFQNNWCSADKEAIIHAFCACDDINVAYLIKKSVHSRDFSVRMLSNGLVNRKLFSVLSRNSTFPASYRTKIQKDLMNEHGWTEENANNLIWEKTEKTSTYQKAKTEIFVLRKTGTKVPLSEYDDYHFIVGSTERHFMCYPKFN